MDLFAQLVSPFVALIAIAVIALAFFWPLWAFLLARRACRDIHSIAESLHWIAHCTRDAEQEEQAKVMRVANSTFGR